MLKIPALQIGPGGLTENNLLMVLGYALLFLILMLYGQRFQTRLMLHELRGSLRKLQGMKDRSRGEALGFIKNSLNPASDPALDVDRFLEYFTILPVDLDPAGIVKKIEHVITLRDERVRDEVRRLATISDKVQMSAAENILEAARVLNLIFKLVRHFVTWGDKTKSPYIIMQLHMLMPIIMQEAEALSNAVDAFKQVQPLGDGAGALVAGRMMLGREKKIIAKDTLLSEAEYKGRAIYLVKAEGPGGNIGEPGTAVAKLIGEMGLKPSAIVMVDAALKLEGEKTGEVAEGIGAAIGGIGVDRFKIEEVATKHNIPLYAVVIKQSIMEAITVMKKEIAEAVDKAVNVVHRILEERTKEGDKVLIVGVGNSMGVSQ